VGLPAFALVGPRADAVRDVDALLGMKGAAFVAP
jgi:hypothetical protein